MPDGNTLMAGESTQVQSGSGNRTLWIVLAVVGVLICCSLIVALLVVGGAAYIFTESRAVPATPAGRQGEHSPPSEYPVGEIIAVPTQPLNHIPDGETYDYNTDPPSSGPHYAEAVPGGFYEEVIEDGYLVHSLEHGYVIIWYNCTPLSASECEQLMGEIVAVMAASGESKLIGVPRPGMDHILALTSWGRIMYLDEFDEGAILHFIEVNINQSPEPNAP